MYLGEFIHLLGSTVQIIDVRLEDVGTRRVAHTRYHFRGFTRLAKLFNLNAAAPCSGKGSGFSTELTLHARVPLVRTLSSGCGLR